MNYKIDTAELTRLIKNFPGAAKIVLDEMRTGMHQSTSVLHEQVAGRTSVFNGHAKGSLIERIYGTPVAINGELAMTATYGAPLEYGRKPGSFPPVDALEYWVIRKLGITEDSRSVAFLIARKIARVGTKGAFMFKEGLVAARPTLDRIWRNVGTRAAQRIEKEITK